MFFQKSDKKFIKYQSKKRSFFTIPSIILLFYSTFVVFIRLFMGKLFLHKYRKIVTFFGSATENLPKEYYEEAQRLASALVKKEFAVITGAGPGIMRAANKGASESGGESIGIGIDIPNEQLNKYTTDYIICKNFFIRKELLLRDSCIYIFFPGGYGTLDEVFLVLTSIKINKLRETPVIFVGKDFWFDFFQLLEKKFLKEFKTINSSDLETFILVDNADEALRYIEKLGLSFCED